jgi:ubiquinone/menaquinone biosynthesis C-methylase UbiE
MLINWNNATWLENRYHPHRDVILEMIKKLQPVSSLLEVGCGYGQNLYRIKKEFPKIEVVGTDIDKSKIEIGLKKITEDGLKVKMEVDDVLTSNLSEKSYDIVLTDALLLMIYMDKDKLKEVMDKLIRTAKKALVMIEFHDDRADVVGENISADTRMVRNYKELLMACGITRASFTKVEREDWDATPWINYGYYIIAKTL